MSPFFQILLAARYDRLEKRQPAKPWRESPKPSYTTRGRSFPPRLRGNRQLELVDVQKIGGCDHRPWLSRWRTGVWNARSGAICEGRCYDLQRGRRVRLYLRLLAG